MFGVYLFVGVGSAGDYGVVGDFAFGIDRGGQDVAGDDGS